VRIKGTKSVNASFPTEQEATDWAVKEETKKKPKSTAYTDEVTLKEVWQIYKDTDAEEKKPQTFKRETYTVRPILKLLGDLALVNITAGEIQKYFDKRKKMVTKRGNKPSPDTLRLEKALLSQLFNTAAIRDHVKHNPAKGFKYKLPPCENRKQRISLEQQKAIFEEAHRLTYKKGQGKRMNACAIPFLKFLFATGMRPGEAAKIQISWLENLVRKPRVVIPSTSTKNKQPRNMTIPRTVLPEIIVQWDRARKAGSEYLFWSKEPKTGKFKPYSYHQAFSKIKKNLGIDAVCHSIRHELVTRLFEETNLSETIIASIIGQRNTASLNNYKHIREEKHREVVDDFQYEQMIQISKLEARVEKQVNSAGLKPAGESLAGSSPAPSTISWK